MATDTNVDHLIINKMTQAQYDSATKHSNELYITPETPASTTNLGPVKVDGTSIKSNNSGVISVGNASASVAGGVTFRYNSSTQTLYIRNDGTPA